MVLAVVVLEEVRLGMVDFMAAVPDIFRAQMGDRASSLLPTLRPFKLIPLLSQNKGPEAAQYLEDQYPVVRPAAESMPPEHKCH
jgi:hypothetical protein